MREPETKYIPLSRSTHQNMLFTTAARYHAAASLSLAPVLIAELVQIIPEYVLCLRREQNGFGLYALLGVNSNAYLTPQLQWQASYIPAVFRGYPFKFARQADNQSVLCVDEAALSSEAGTALFDETGELSEAVNNAVRFLQKSQQNIAQTQKAMADLAAADLIEPWPLQLKTAAHPKGVRLSDIFKINEKALNALDGEALISLRQSGALALAYGQLYAMGRLKQLQLRLDKHTPVTGSDNADMPDFEQLFDGQEDDDYLQF